MSENMGSIYATLELAIKDFINNAEEAKKVVKKNSDSIKESIENLNKSAKENFEKIGEASSLIGGGLASAGAVVGASLLLISDQFESTEESMRKFSAQTGKSGKELESFQTSIKETYLDEYGDNIEEVTQLYSSFTRELKTNAKETKELTEGAFQLRDVFDVEVDSSLRAVSSAFKNLGMEGPKTLDLITKTMQITGDSSGDLLDTIVEYSARFAEAGFNGEEMFNILNKGVQSGARDFDTVADSVKEFNIILTEGTDEGTEALTQLFGSAKKAKQMMASIADGSLSTGEAMKQVAQEIGKVDDKTEQAQISGALFGTLFEEVGIKGLIAMTNGKNAIGEFDGALKKANETSKGNVTTMEQVKRQFGEVSQKIGAELAPYISDLLLKVSNLLSKFLEFIKVNPMMTKIIAVIGVVLSIVGAIMGAIILIAPYVGTLVAGFSALGVVITNIGLVASAVFGALISWPVLIIVGIVALVALIILKWDLIKTTTINIWGAIVEFISNVPTILKNLWNNFIIWIVELWNSFKTQTSNIWNSILEFIKNIPGMLFNFFTSTLPFFIAFVIGSFIRLQIKITQIIINLFTVKIPNLIIKGLNMAKNFFTVTIPQLIQKIQNLRNQIIIKLGLMAVSMGVKAKEGFNNIIKWFRQLPSKVLQFGTNLFNSTKTLGKKMIDGLKNFKKEIPNIINNTIQSAINGIGKFGSVAWKALKNIGSSMWNGFKKGLGINSPSYLEEAMFNISDAGEDLKKNLYHQFRSIKNLPKITAMANIANEQEKQASNTSNTIQNFNGPLVSIDGESNYTEGSRTAFSLYDMITFRKKSMGV